MSSRHFKDILGHFRLARDMFFDIFLAHPRKGSWDMFFDILKGIDILWAYSGRSHYGDRPQSLPNSRREAVDTRSNVLGAFAKCTLLEGTSPVPADVQASTRRRHEMPRSASNHFDALLS